MTLIIAKLSFFVWTVQRFQVLKNKIQNLKYNNTQQYWPITFIQYVKYTILWQLCTTQTLPSHPLPKHSCDWLVHYICCLKPLNLIKVI